ncbi:hypothetical protein BJ979_000124 [Schumannella luteola]|uniref:Uncharacterized protein n=1 Tax=Schumannella luteola TaxID=472059 RepID=A0A852YEF4_9MICO|nr:hypothetical protein [Schumannella luteola]
MSAATGSGDGPVATGGASMPNSWLRVAPIVVGLAL